MNDEAVEGVADADAARLSIQDDSLCFLHIGSAIHIAMHYSSARLNDRYLCMLTDIIDQSAAATRDDKIHQRVSREQTVCVLVAGEQQSCLCGHAVTLQDFVDKGDNSPTAVLGIATAFENAGAAGLQTKSEAVEANIRSGFEDDTNNTKGYAHSVELQTIRQNAMLQHTSQWRRQRSHLSQVRGNILQAGFGQLQAVVTRVGLVHSA